MVDNKHKNISLKFTSSLLNRPFSSQLNDREPEIDEEIVEDNPEHNMTNYNMNNNKAIPVDFSTSSIMKNNNDSLNTSKNSMNATISFNKRELLSQFNNQNQEGNNESNNIVSSSSSSNLKKRKPFDKLSFHSDSVTNQNSNNLINNNNPTNTSIISNNENTSAIMNNSGITEVEKSMILSSYKLLSKSTLEKAKLFNNQYKNSTPFWIKFFEEIENDSLKSNSSYYKYNLDKKSEYVKSLIEMVQRDADIYDSMNKNNNVKKETQQSIKHILDESELNKSTVSSKSNRSKSAKNDEQEEIDKNNIKIDNKLAQGLTEYDKLYEKDKKYYNSEADYDTFKFNLITGGKFTNEKKKNEPTLEEKMQKIEEEENRKNEEEKKKQKEIKDYKTIDTLYFGDNYTFEELNYDKIDFCAYNKDSIKKLLELDRKLNKIDPKRYTTSINTELKKIQDEFNAGKKERFNRINKETREQFKKYLKDTQETKKTIFDIEPKDETKIKYKDYLREQAEQKKHKKEIDDKLKRLDNLIKENNKRDVPQSKKEEIKKELEAYHNTEEYKNKFNEMKVPGMIQLQKVTSDINNFDKKNKQLMSDLENMQKEVKEEEEKNKEMLKNKAEEEAKYQREVVQPFLQYEKELDDFHSDNNKMLDKITSIEKQNDKEEEKLKEAQEQINQLLKGKDDYEKLFEEADKLFYSEEKNEEPQTVNEITKEDLYKKYGLDEVMTNEEEGDIEEEKRLQEEKEEFEKIKAEMDKEYEQLQLKDNELDKNESNPAKEYFDMIEKEDREERAKNAIKEEIKEEDMNDINKESNFEEDSLE